MSEYKKIPSVVKMGGQIINISFEEYLEGHCGESNEARGLISIANRFDRQKDGIQTESSKVNTFYHELVHCILGTMCERDLDNNEKFVSCFAGFLTDALENAYFKED